MGPNGIRGTRGVPCARGKRRADHHRRCFDVLGQRSSGWGRCACILGPVLRARVLDRAAGDV